MVNGVVSISLPEIPLSHRPGEASVAPAAAPSRTFFAGHENRLAVVAIGEFLNDDQGNGDQINDGRVNDDQVSNHQVSADQVSNYQVNNGTDELPLHVESVHEIAGSNDHSDQGARSSQGPLGRNHGPLVLYGPVGSGKSHLAIGVALEFRRRYPGEPVAVTTAAEFSQSLSDAKASHTLAEFRRRHRNVSLLVVDDLGEMAGSPSGQVELIHTIDALLRRQARLLLTSAVAPVELPGLLPMLRSRLAAGLAVPLALPEEPARRAILQSLAKERGASLPKPVLRLLAEGLRGSARDLQGTLLSLEASSRGSGGISLELAERHVAARSVRRSADLRRIAVQTARCFALKVADLKSASRRKGVVLARGVAMYLARQMTPLSLEQIGAFFGGRDHSTVLHGCRKTEELLNSDRVVLQAVLELRRKMAAAECVEEL